MEMMAGSLALVGSRPGERFFRGAETARGLCLQLGKTNLSEWANIRSSHYVSGTKGRRRAHHRAVGLGADGKPAEIGAPWPRRARTRAARIAIQRVGIPGKPAAAAPSADRMAGANVRPLAEVGLAQMTAPASRSFCATKESFAGREPTSASDPAVVCMRSAVSMLSLIRTGTPCSGPRAPLALRSWSSACAMARASGLSSITLLTAGPRRSISPIRASISG